MDLLSPSPTTNSPLTPVFGDNVQDLLGTGALNVNPTGIIVVNSIADTVDDPNSGVITLRDAINQANTDAGEDLIVFYRSLFSNAQTITLSGTELDITHNLEIIAPRDPLTGEDLVTVSGNKASRVFEIGAGATASIDGLIVADGKVQDDNGGGIKNSGILTLDSTIVRNNTAFSVDFSYLIGNGSGIYNSGNLTVNNSTISGNSAGNAGTLKVDSSNGGGISNAGTLKVNSSTISGNSARDGGGIYNFYNNLNASNTSTVNNSTISGNSASFDGGGIFNASTLKVNNSTISGNSASFNGGGIYSNAYQSTLFLSNSTISDNSARSGGGGIYSADYTLKVNNSTLSGNSACSGGGIDTSSIGTIDNSTLSGNSVTSGYGGGIFSTFNSVIKVRNTIIAANLNSTNGINTDAYGTFRSNGYNLIGDSTGSNAYDLSIAYNLILDNISTGFASPGDIVGTSDNPIDPRLAPLNFNGGPTQNFALLPDSPAIDAGDPTLLDTDPTTDQRGLPRVVNGRADIGAYEVQV